jgi:hypothetical protein
VPARHRDIARPLFGGFLPIPSDAVIVRSFGFHGSRFLLPIAQARFALLTVADGPLAALGAKLMQHGVGPEHRPMVDEISLRFGYHIFLAFPRGIRFTKRNIAHARGTRLLFIEFCEAAFWHSAKQR